MGFSKKNQIVKIRDTWYVETRTGYEGPFEKLSDAKKYLLLANTADVARLEFAGLSFSSLD